MSDLEKQSWAGLVPTKQELEQERYLSNLKREVKIYIAALEKFAKRVYLIDGKFHGIDADPATIAEEALSEALTENIKEKKKEKDLTVLYHKVNMLTRALEAIRDHEHCREDRVHWPSPTHDPFDDSQWRMGYSQGHRHCSKIAATALEEIAK